MHRCLTVSLLRSDSPRMPSLSCGNACMIAKGEPANSAGKAVLAAGVTLAPVEPCMAQSWVPWGDFCGAPSKDGEPRRLDDRSLRSEEREKSLNREKSARLAD